MCVRRGAVARGVWSAAPGGELGSRGRSHSGAQGHCHARTLSAIVAVCSSRWVGASLAPGGVASCCRRTGVSARSATRRGPAARAHRRGVRGPQARSRALLHTRPRWSAPAGRCPRRAARIRRDRCHRLGKERPGTRGLEVRWRDFGLENNKGISKDLNNKRRVILYDDNLIRCA